MIRMPYIPARYVYLVVRVLDMFASSLIEGCMALAITSMVRSTTASTSDSGSTATNINMSSDDVCPRSGAQTNHTSTTVQQVAGDFDWDELLQSYVTNGVSYGALFSMMVAARLVQMSSPKMMSIVAAVLTSLGNVLTPLLAHWSVYALITCRVVLGIATGLDCSQGINMPVLFALDSTWFPPDERQKLCGIIFGSMNIAAIFSSSLTGYLIGKFGWEFVFYFYGGVRLLSLCLWVFTVYDSPMVHPRISEEERMHITSTVKKETEVKLPVPWLHIFLSAPVWAYLSISISNSWITFVLNSELPTYLTKLLNYSTTDAGYLVSACNAVGFLTQLSSGFISGWLQTKKYIGHLTSYKIFNGIVTLGTAAALIGITQSSCNTVAIVAFLLLIKSSQSVIIAGSFLNHMDLAINFVPTLSGINGTIGSAVGILSPTIAAAIINNNQTISAWGKVFYISAAVSALPYVIFFIFGSVEEQPWNKVQVSEKKNETKHEVEPHESDKSTSASYSVDMK